MAFILAPTQWKMMGLWAANVNRLYSGGWVLLLPFSSCCPFRDGRLPLLFHSSDLLEGHHRKVRLLFSFLSSPSAGNPDLSKSLPIVFCRTMSPCILCFCSYLWFIFPVLTHKTQATSVLQVPRQALKKQMTDTCHTIKQDEKRHKMW